jgi:hypothetical protein
MNVKYIALAVIVIAVSAGCWRLWIKNSAQLDDPYGSWSPTQEDIFKAVGGGGPGTWRDARHLKFAAMFQERFRSRKYPVRIFFTSPNKAILFCGAMIPVGQIAHISLQAFNEAKGVFNKNYDVEVFETYIMMRPRKLADVRMDGKYGVPVCKFVWAEPNERPQYLMHYPTNPTPIDTSQP